MRYKNLSICLFSVVLFCLNAQAQVINRGIADSSVIPAKQMKQQNEFWNNTYSFPAKPRNKWEAGASFGTVLVSSDIPVVAPTFGFSAHVRKSLGYLFSLRLQYLNGTAKGLMWQQALVNQTETIEQLSGVGIIPRGIKGSNKLHVPTNRFGLVEPHVIGKVSDILFRGSFAGRDRLAQCGPR